MVNKIGFLIIVAYSFSIITIIIGIAILLTAPSPDTALVGVAVIIVGFIAIWVFRKSVQEARIKRKSK
jgi:membrane protein implicated in regulation of membrane protease activity